MPKLKRVHGEYQVGDGDVTLRIAVGDGQLGTSLVRLDDRDLASGSLGMLLLGPGGALAGRRLRIATTVTDVQRLTNRTSVRYTLSGGPEEARFDAAAEVEHEGDSVHYSARFDFVR
jgi:hypothetical protein